MRKILLLCAAALALGTPAIADTPATTCIRQNDISNWTSLNDKSIVLEDYRHQKVLLKLLGTCSGFAFSETLEIRARGASRLSCVSPGDDIVTLDGLRGGCSV